MKQQKQVAQQNRNLHVHFQVKPEELSEEYWCVVKCGWWDCGEKFIMVSFRNGNPVCPHCGRESF